MGYTTKFKGRFDIIDSESGKKVAIKGKAKKVLNILSNNDTRDLHKFSHDELPKSGDNINFVIEGVEFNTNFYSYYCQWVLTEDEDGIEWDQNEKFYEYEKWLNIILEKVLRPNGFDLVGQVAYRGEAFEDIGVLIAEPTKKIKNVTNVLEEYFEQEED